MKLYRAIPSMVDDKVVYRNKEGLFFGHYRKLWFKIETSDTEIDVPVKPIPKNNWPVVKIDSSWDLSCFNEDDVMEANLSRFRWANSKMVLTKPDNLQEVSIVDLEGKDIESDVTALMRYFFCKDNLRNGLLSLSGTIIVKGGVSLALKHYLKILSQRKELDKPYTFEHIELTFGKLGLVLHVWLNMPNPQHFSITL